METKCVSVKLTLNLRFRIPSFYMDSNSRLCLTNPLRSTNASVSLSSLSYSCIQASRNRIHNVFSSSLSKHCPILTIFAELLSSQKKKVGDLFLGHKMYHILLFYLRILMTRHGHTEP